MFKNSLQFYLFFLLIIVIVFSFFRNKHGSGKEIKLVKPFYEIVSSDFQKLDFKEIKKIADIYCKESKPHLSLEFLRLPESLAKRLDLKSEEKKIKEDLDEFHKFSSMRITLTANYIGFFYHSARFIDKFDIKEVILLGTFGGYLPLALIKAFKDLKIHWFSLKNYGSFFEKESEGRIILYERFPTDNDLAELQEVSLLNFASFIGKTHSSESRKASKIFTSSYANNIIYKLRPKYSLTKVLFEDPLVLLPYGKIYIIPFYFSSSTFILETEKDLTEEEYNGSKLWGSALIFNCCVRNLKYPGNNNFDTWALEFIENSLKTKINLKKICEEYIAKLPKIKFSEDFYQNLDLISKYITFPYKSNKEFMDFRVVTSDQIEKSIYDEDYDNLYIPITLSLKEIKTVIEKFNINYSIKNINLPKFEAKVNYIKNYKSFVLLSDSFLKKKYAYYIYSEEELYLLENNLISIKNFKFYVLKTLKPKYSQVIYYDFVKNKEECLELAKKREEVFIENFNKKEFIEPTAVLLKEKFTKENLPYPIRMWIPNDDFLIKVLLQAFFNSILIIDSLEKCFNKRIFSLKKEEFLETNDYIFYN